jgi:hypothetical protein
VQIEAGTQELKKRSNFYVSTLEENSLEIEKL